MKEVQFSKVGLSERPRRGLSVLAQDKVDYSTFYQEGPSLQVSVVVGQQSAQFCSF